MTEAIKKHPVNTISNKSFEAANSNTADAIARTKRILFTAPSTCGQLQIARYFWEFYGPETIEASFAALEVTDINQSLNACMSEYEVSLHPYQVESIFSLSTQKKDFACVVSLGGNQNYGSNSPFIETISILFGKHTARINWDIPDPESVFHPDQSANAFAENIRNLIEFEIAQLAQSLEEQSQAG